MHSVFVSGNGSFEAARPVIVCRAEQDAVLVYNEISRYIDMNFPRRGWSMKFRERIHSDILIFDGAMGTQLHELDPSEDDYQGLLGCSEILNISMPEKIRQIHENYFAAGSDIVETNSFGSNAIVLAEYGIAERARELSRLSAQIARSAADAWQSAVPGKPRYVAGSMGPGTKLISLNQTDWAEMYASYRDHAGGLLEGGADALLIETCQDPLQIKCAVVAAQDEMDSLGLDVPIMVSFTVETTGTLLVGSEVPAVFAAIAPLGIDTLGMNCATGPEDMKNYVRQLSSISPLPMSVYPNAGLPQNVNGELVYTLAVEDFVRDMTGFIAEDGVSIVGGCCGTNPAFIKALYDDIQSRRSTDPHWGPAERTPEFPPSVAGLFSAQSLSQDQSAFFIGERTNTNGSKKFRELLLEENWDALVDVAREQVQSGVHALDLCVAYTGRDEVRDMSQTLRRMVTQVPLPLVIDSTELPVMEAALQMYGGRAIINSINLEDGEGRADKVCRLAKRYGAALIALTIDEDGMARDPEKKLSIAKRIYDIAVNRHGLNASDLIFDPLTFTLGSGDDSMTESAMATMEGIRRIKAEIPGVYTVLGLSNVSFGLNPASRRVLNSVFLADAVEAGLDMAIVNLRHIVPLANLSDRDVEVARNLIYNRMDRSDEAPDGDNALFQFIAYFSGRSGELAAGDSGDDESLPLGERIGKKVIQGSKGNMKEMLESALEDHGPIHIINEMLIPAMKVVGKLFGEGKMQLPFVLQSAEVMKYSVDILEPYMEKSETSEQKSIVLATVRGDVHDIGKNLVDIILSNNGYKVYNLGIKCEIDAIIRKAQEVGADAIGMSGLLVKSTIIMKENLEELNRRKIDIPVLLGGAALTPSYVWDTCAKLLDAPVVYCADAFAGLRTMNLIKEGNIGEFVAAEQERRSKRPAPRPRVKKDVPERVEVDRSVNIPAAPFLGTRVVEGIDLDEVYAYLTEEVLFRGRWGYRRGKLGKEEYEDLIENTVRPEFEALKADARRRHLLEPRVVYGYFECNADGEDVIIYHPESGGETARFSFPRQAEAPRQCIADYFLPLGGGKRDIIVLQIATVGMSAHEHSQQLYDSNAYKDYLLFHGLSVETAEALAEYWHLKVRQELGITGEDGEGIQDFVVQKYRGSRYSFGYPACPDLSQNRILCELLDSEAIGVTVSDEDQMVPEQTTSAFVVHHPQAKYFNVD
jgi:5-methyltetrahydrofolate--homocysteine methyltransferase